MPSPTPAVGAPDAPTFASFDIPRPTVDALAAQGITTAYPIQAATLRDALAGRDVIGRGRTGSGKTIAFALPVVTRLAAVGAAGSPSGSARAAQPRQRRRPRALVLVPTRELATQVAATFAPLADAVGLRVTTIFGGVGQNPQVRALADGVDIVVACPGRLEDLVGQGACSLDAVEITVLDEADHLADLGFLPAVRRLLDATPKRGQRLLFSATIDQAIDVVVKRYLHQPIVHAVDELAVQVPDTEHHALHVGTADKPAVVRALASGHGRTMLFTRTKHGAKKLAKQLTANGIPAVELHGNLSQGARERNLDNFATGHAKVLVATDIAARGIHVDEVALVVHVDPPTEHKAYLHRSGRTARAGARGTVVTLATPDQQRDVAKLARAAGVLHHVTAVDPAHPLLAELRGPEAPIVHHAPAPVPPPAARAAKAPRAEGASAGRGRRRGNADAPRPGGTRAATGAGRGRRRRGRGGAVNRSAR